MMFLIGLCSIKAGSVKMTSSTQHSKDNEFEVFTPCKVIMTILDSGFYDSNSVSYVLDSRLHPMDFGFQKFYF